MNILSAAMGYVDRGYPVFPIVPLGKRPATENGFHDATLDEDQLDDWFTPNPTYNIGIPTDGLVVIDCDPGSEDWYLKRRDSFQMAGAVVSQTPRGGWHIIFRMPEGEDIRCSSGKVGENIDIRANGGYIVVSPSLVKQKDGPNKPYVWLDDLPDREKLAEIPPALLEEVKRGNERKVPIQNAQGKVTAGGRHDFLFAAGRDLMEVGMSDDLMYSTLHALNIERCDPPLTNGDVQGGREGVDSELKRVIRDLRRRGRNKLQPGEDPWIDEFIENVFQGKASYSQFLDATSSDLDEPEGLDDIPSHFVDNLPDLCQVAFDYYKAAHAYRVLPELWLGSWIAFTGAVMSRATMSPGGTRTNVFCIGLAPTGGGKEATRGWVDPIDCDQTTGDRVMNNGRHTHASAIGTTIREANPTCLSLDEFGLVIQQAFDAKRGDGNLRTMFDMLLELYSASSKQVWVSTQYSKKIDRLSPIEYPCLSMWNVSTQKTFWEGLTGERVYSGLIPRFLVFNSGRARELNHPDATISPPEELLAFKRRWVEKDSLLGFMRPGETISIHPDAETVIVDASERLESTINDQKPETLVWSRFRQTAVKLAMIHAGWRHAGDEGLPEVLAEDAIWSVGVVEFLVQRLVSHSKSQIHDNEFDRIQSKIVRAIQRKHRGDGWCSQGELTRHIRANDLNYVMKQLVAAGIVESTIESTARRPLTLYRLA